MNSFGTHFRLTTYGESHGSAIGGVIDGCPAGMSLDLTSIKHHLARRRGDGIDGVTSRQEPDNVEFLSGIYEGRTLGTPIAFVIKNEDCRSEDYAELKDWCRPGHADYTYIARFGVRDPRGGGRASGRETAARVVAGSIARQILSEKNIAIDAHAILPDHIDTGETYGGIVSCQINGVPKGFGNPIFDKLNARLAHSMMSIPSAIGFEMGIGFQAAQMTGHQFVDQWNDTPSPLTRTNHCGGIQGGISNGMPISFRTAFHAVPTQQGETACLNVSGEQKKISIKGRHDHCHVRRLPVIVESMAALVLVDFFLEHHE